MSASKDINLKYVLPLCYFKVPDQVYSRNTAHLHVAAKSALSVGVCQIIIRETPSVNYSG